MPSRRARVRRFLAVQPDGWVLAEDHRGIVAVGGCVAYQPGGFGWIGLVATAPECQGEGLGARVTQWLVDRLADHGCAAVLDASDAGAPVYRRLGFVDHGLTVRYEVPADIDHAYDEVRPLEIEDLPAVTVFDAVRFGADRSRLLRVVLAEAPQAWVAVTDGQVRGYAASDGAVIAPLVADDEVALRSLLGAAVGSQAPDGPPLTMTVTPDSGHHDSLLALGLRPVRTLVHQRLGIDALPGNRAALCAQISLGEG